MIQLVLLTNLNSAQRLYFSTSSRRMSRRACIFAFPARRPDLAHGAGLVDVQQHALAWLARQTRPCRQQLARPVEIPLVHGYVVAEGIVDSGEGRFAGERGEVVGFKRFKSFTKG